MKRSFAVPVQVVRFLDDRLAPTTQKARQLSACKCILTRNPGLALLRSVEIIKSYFFLCKLNIPAIVVIDSGVRIVICRLMSPKM